MAELVFHLNAGTLWANGAQSAAPRLNGETDWSRVKDHGFCGLQHYFPDEGAINAGLEMSGMARIIRPEEARNVARTHAGWGFVCSTWHVGHGFETDAEIDALAQAVLDASSETGLPIYVETHRATMTQDMRRTLDLVERYPALRFNADLSHWYTGAEMPYGDFEEKVARLKPVFERVRYVHGRIGHSCSMQLPLSVARTHECWRHYSILWRAMFDACKLTAKKGEPIIFAPELLPSRLEHEGRLHHLNYAFEHDGVELSDRWADALQLVALAQELFDTGRRS